jgi:serine/threonine protein kinase
MGEVYRARDPKLHRDVAIKILPEALATDSAALARFEREAQAVAALGLIWVFAGVAGDRKRSLLINGPSVQTRSDRYRPLFRRAC